MGAKSLRRVLKEDGKSASYCCEAAETVKADQLPKEDAFKKMKRRLGKNDQSASYCCEAADTLLAKQLPPEDAF